MVGLTFAIKPLKKQRVKSTKKTLTQVIRGKVVMVDGVYKCNTKYQDKSITVDFTPESFIMKGKTNGFKPDVKDPTKWCRFIKNETDVIGMPFSQDYLPFVPNWIVSGKLIIDNGKIMFDFKNLITIHNFANGWY